MGGTIDLETLQKFAIALLIGALVGLEREHRKPAQGSSGVPGIRTFTLMALIGAVAAWLSREFDTPWIFVGASLGVSAAVVAGYVVQARRDPESIGLTTELAGLAVCLLGALTVVGSASLAVGLAIVVSALLAFKQPIHSLARKLGPEDIYAVLKLLIATFIVLPVLPDRTIDPWGALNPYKLWLLVVLISGLSLVGYVATRWLGAERGLAITGFTGGLVSSTAVTLSFARRSRELANTGAADAGNALATGILLGWLVIVGRIVVLVAVVHLDLLWAILLPAVVMGVTTLAMATVFHFRSPKSSATAANSPNEVPLKNPFSLTAAVKFALLFAVVLLVVKVAQKYFPGGGLYLVAGLAGLTDVDAITLSMAEYAKGGGVADKAAMAIIIAALSNTLVKAGLAVGLGSDTLRGRMTLATAIIMASVITSLFFV
jgi:uncharacterized membrane protein (DUF4010 family)